MTRDRQYAEAQHGKKYFRAVDTGGFTVGSGEQLVNAVREQAQRAYAETLDATTSIQVYGTPSDTVLEMLRQQAGSGVSLSVRRYHLGGFTRLRTS